MAGPAGGPPSGRCWRHSAPSPGFPLDRGRRDRPCPGVTPLSGPPSGTGVSPACFPSASGLEISDRAQRPVCRAWPPAVLRCGRPPCRRPPCVPAQTCGQTHGPVATSRGPGWSRAGAGGCWPSCLGSCCVLSPQDSERFVVAGPGAAQWLALAQRLRRPADWGRQRVTDFASTGTAVLAGTGESSWRRRASSLR